MADTETITLTGLSLWDGERRLDADAIRLRGPVIDAIGDAADLTPGSRTVNYAGCWAVPGLIDAHVHLELDPEAKAPPERTRPDVIPRMAERAASMVRAGITTARDLGGGAWYELDLRDRIHRGELPGPRLLCAGQPLTSPGGHCHFWGGEAADLTAARAVFDRQVAHGVDLIKVMATGGRMTPGSTPVNAQFDQQTLNAVVQWARGRNLAVAAHCHGTEGIARAARAGVRSIEHCSWVGPAGWATDYQDAVAQLILEQRVWVSPTVNRGWQRMLDGAGNRPRISAAFDQMRALGIPMVASTDAGIPGVFHADLPLALPVFARIAGLSATETLISATSHAADCLGLRSVCGRLLTGLSADLLILSSDPGQNLSALADPAAVWSRGCLIR